MDSQFIQAIKNGDAAALRELLSDVEPSLFAQTIGQEDHSRHSFGAGTTLLQFASFRKWKETSSEVNDLLIQSGAEIDFHAASGLGLVDVLESLIQQHSAAELLSREVDTFVPMQYAISANRPGSAAVLLQHGDDPNRSCKKVGWFVWEDESLAKGEPMNWNPIHMAAIWKRKEIASLLADAGADLNAICSLDGCQAIHLAAMYNGVEMIQFLSDRGVGVDSRTKLPKKDHFPDAGMDGPTVGNDWTPLMVTVGEGFIETGQWLIKNGSDVTAANALGRTALHIAAGGFWAEREPIYLELVQSLLAAGADPNRKDDQGNLPIDYAKRKKYDSVVSALAG